MAWDKARTGRWLVISIVITIVVTALLWTVFPGALFGFLFLPFLPFAFGRRRGSDASSPGSYGAHARMCPDCGYVGRPEDRFRPRDGSALR